MWLYNDRVSPCFTSATSPGSAGYASAFGARAGIMKWHRGCKGWQHLFQAVHHIFNLVAVEVGTTDDDHLLLPSSTFEVPRSQLVPRSPGPNWSQLVLTDPTVGSCDQIRWWDQVIQWIQCITGTCQVQLTILDESNVPGVEPVILHESLSIGLLVLEVSGCDHRSSKALRH